MLVWLYGDIILCLLLLEMSERSSRLYAYNMHIPLMDPDPVQCYSHTVTVIYEYLSINNHY